MVEEQLKHLRSLRRRCKALLDSAAEDISSFKAEDGLTFRWLQGSQGRVSIASTCTCLMTAVALDKLDEIYPAPAGTPDAGSFGRKQALAALATVFQEEWISSGLPDGNPFTSVIVARTTAVLAAAGMIACDEAKALEHDGPAGRKRLDVRIWELAAKAPESLNIRQFPAHPATMFWLFDAIERLAVPIVGPTWRKVAQWSATTFFRELSQVVSQNDALMDPVALVMAACCCRRIQLLASENTIGDSDVLLAELPSLVELQYAVTQFLNKRSPSGAWPNYFPLFRYEGGANHCFAFECLEAILLSFGQSTLFEDELSLKAFADALAWCEQNKLHYAVEGKRYAGWNSGGDRRVLALGQPEVWATGTIHIFAQHFRQLLDSRIQKAIEEKYQATFERNSGRWDRLIDLPLRLDDEETTLKTVLLQQVIEPIAARGKPKRRSGLLFGPPGTSKTSLVRALAENVGWSMIYVTPSGFLRGGLENIYVSAEEIFEDLSDLRRAVILFDEMDALVRRRDGAEKLDTTQQFLTTTMLPILTRLHERDDVVFFIATNHKKTFDDAIIRPGRFDMLFCVGPPTWEAKLRCIESFCQGEDLDALGREFSRLVRGDTGTKLDYFTYGEFASLVSDLKRTSDRTTCLEALQGMRMEDFRRKVRTWHENKITLKPRSPARIDYDEDRGQSRLQ